MTIEGRWRIVEMEVWDREALDLLGPAFIEIEADGHGSVRFVAFERSLRPCVQLLDTGGYVLD